MQSINKIQLSLNRNVIPLKGFFILFYTVGVAGLSFSFTYSLFIKLIPFALLLTTIALAFYHGPFTKKEIAVFAAIFTSGFFIEALGVNTGAIFGQYHYGQGLGLKLLNTPLMIGLNWLLLVYLSASVMEQTAIPAALKIAAAALLMVGYDLVLEQVAPELDMWYWQNGYAPLQNYLSWFIIAIAFHTIARMFKTGMKNKIGPFLFVCQSVFFILLFIITS